MTRALKCEIQPISAQIRTPKLYELINFANIFEGNNTRLDCPDPNARVSAKQYKQVKSFMRIYSFGNIAMFVSCSRLDVKGVRLSA